MSAYIDWAGTADAAPYLKVNAGFAALGQALLFAHKESADTGLGVGIGGGPWVPGSPDLDDEVVACADDDVTYIVALRVTGVLSASTATTDWDNTDTYGHVATATFAEGVLTAFKDYRLSEGGILRGAAASSTQQYPVSGAPGTDDSWSGRAITGVNAGATIAQWQSLYLGSGGEWLLADASSDSTAPMRALAATAGTDNNPLTVVTEGVIRNDAWAWTPGGSLYLSTTAGGLTQTPPSASGEIVQPVGFAISADVIYLNVGQATFIELV